MTRTTYVLLTYRPILISLDRRTVASSGERNFCSRACDMSGYLFKNAIETLLFTQIDYL